MSRGPMKTVGLSYTPEPMPAILADRPMGADCPRW